MGKSAAALKIRRRICMDGRTVRWSTPSASTTQRMFSKAFGEMKPLSSVKDSTRSPYFSTASLSVYELSLPPLLHKTAS